MLLDALIRNAIVIDGTGRPSFLADVGIQGDRIVVVGSGVNALATEIVDADGLHLSPGFIDVHSHDDLAVLHDPGVPYKVLQGVTTTIVGNCGLAPAPVSSDPALRSLLRAYVQPVLGHWSSGAEETFGFPQVSDYLAAVGQVPITINVAALVAHGSLRIAAMGFSDRQASEPELALMEEQLEDALHAGALGLSLGLMYAPGCFADMEELVRLGRVVARHKGVVAAHIRGEGNLLMPSIAEMIELARKTGASVHISHLKAVGIRNWGAVNHAIDVIRKAREEGLDITCDAYPYAAGSTTILSLLPPWALEGGVGKTLDRLKHPDQRARIIRDLLEPGSDWDNVAYLTGFDRIVLTSSASPSLQRFTSMSFAEIAEIMECTPVEAYVNVVSEGGGSETIVIHHMSEEDVRRVFQFEPTLVGSDGLPSPNGHPHPRLYGTFPRVLGRFVRDEGLLPLEVAVHKMTGASARRFRLTDRGQIAPGYRADLVLFDAGGVADLATYSEPRLPARGVVRVMVNGRWVVESGRHTGNTPGRVLRRRVSVDDTHSA